MSNLWLSLDPNGGRLRLLVVAILSLVVIVIVIIVREDQRIAND
jgi:hypothetical protein